MNKPRRRVVMLGAGFSYCTTRGELPLTANLLDRLTESHYPALWRFVQSLGDGHTVDLERTIRELDTLYEIPVKRYRTAILEPAQDPAAISRELGAYCIQRLCCDNRSGWSWAADFLACAGWDATIITTNYDSLAERILSNMTMRSHGSSGNCPHCKMKELLQSSCPCGPRGRPDEGVWRGALIKLHGSVAWRTCRNAPCLGQDCLIPDALCQPFARQPCPCCSGSCEPVLVMPKLRSKYLQFPRMHAMWDAAFAALEDAEELLVFGFSFPAADMEVCGLFKQALSKNPSLRQVWIVDVVPEAVAQRLRPLLPSRAVALETLEVPTSFEIPAWWIKMCEEVLHPQPGTTPVS